MEPCTKSSSPSRWGCRWAESRLLHHACMHGEGSSSSAPLVAASSEMVWDGPPFRSRDRKRRAEQGGVASRDNTTTTNRRDAGAWACVRLRLPAGHDLKHDWRSFYSNFNSTTTEYLCLEYCSPSKLEGDGRSSECSCGYGSQSGRLPEVEPQADRRPWP